MRTEQAEDKIVTQLRVLNAQLMELNEQAYEVEAAIRHTKTKLRAAELRAAAKALQALRAEEVKEELLTVGLGYGQGRGGIYDG